MAASKNAKRVADGVGEDWPAVVRKVADDVTTGLGEFFPATGGFVLAPGFRDASPMTNGAHTAVVWEYSGVHARDFQGIRPTSAPVVIRGVTVVFDTPQQPTLFHRYVDWADVMAQLGLSVTGRPAVDALPPEPGDRPD